MRVILQQDRLEMRKTSLVMETSMPTVVETCKRSKHSLTAVIKELNL